MLSIRQKNRTSDDQVLKSYSFSLDTAKAAAGAIEAASAAHGGRVPDAFFLCAGASKPMFYLEMTEDDHTRGMTTGYWLQAWSAFVSLHVPALYMTRTHASRCIRRT